MLSAAEIYQFFRQSGEPRRNSEGGFGFRVPLSCPEGVSDPGLPLPDRKVPEQAAESPKATAKH